MKYSGKTDKYKAEKYLDHLIESNCDFEIKKLNKNRTLSQNDSIHLFCTWIATLYNDNGHTYKNPLGIETIWTMNMVKELIWKPLQLDLCCTAQFCYELSAFIVGYIVLCLYLLFRININYNNLRILFGELQQLLYL